MDDSKPNLVVRGGGREGEVRDDAPMPPLKGRGRPSSLKWAFLSQLEVYPDPCSSTHFKFGLDEVDEMRAFRTRLDAAVARLQKKTEKKFMVRTTPEGVAVWRTE